MYMYVYLYVSLYLCLYLPVYCELCTVCVYVCKCVSLSLSLWVCVIEGEYAWVWVCVGVCMSAWVWVNEYEWVCVCLSKKLDSKMIKALEMNVSSSKTFLVLILNNLQVLLVWIRFVKWGEMEPIPATPYPRFSEEKKLLRKVCSKISENTNFLKSREKCEKESK